MPKLEIEFSVAEVVDAIMPIIRGIIGESGTASFVGMSKEGGVVFTVSQVSMADIKPSVTDHNIDLTDTNTTSDTRNTISGTSVATQNKLFMAKFKEKCQDHSNVAEPESGQKNNAPTPDTKSTEAKFMTPAELSTIIMDWHKAGKTDSEISDLLQQKYGIYFNEATVFKRIKRIKAGEI